MRTELQTTDDLEEAVDIIIMRNMETITNLALTYSFEAELMVHIIQSISVLLSRATSENRTIMLERMTKEIAEMSEHFANLAKNAEH